LLVYIQKDEQCNVNKREYKEYNVRQQKGIIDISIASDLLYNPD